MSQLTHDPIPHDQLTRDYLLDELQHSQRQVVQLLEAMADVQDWQPEPAEWSFRLIAAHLATVEQKCHLRRVRRIASGQAPHFSHYAGIGDHFAAYDLHDSLRRWVATRQELIAFVRNLAEPQLAFVGFHEAVGPMTILDALQEMLDQDQGNFRHVYQLIIAYHIDLQKTAVFCADEEAM
jgi:hypothetical protein